MKVARMRAKVKIRLGAISFGEFCIGGIGDVLVSALPRSTSTRTLFFHGALKANCVELEAEVACSIFHEVPRQSIGVIKHECLVTWQYAQTLILLLFLSQNRASTERKEDALEFVLAYQQTVIESDFLAQHIRRNAGRDNL